MGIASRIYSDYLMSSRLGEYRDIMKQVLSEGYEVIGVADYYIEMLAGRLAKPRKILVNRHDIDTDVNTARRIFEIEKELNARSTFYFRLNTLNVPLMREIKEAGWEVGYHFEEVASYAKRNGIRTKEEILDKLEHIRREFEANFCSVQNMLGFRINTVASHGDFANRVLGVTNHLITDCAELRDKLDILAEAYDVRLLSSFDIYLADRPPPVGFAPMGPVDAMLAGHKKICMLTHPRHWHASWVDNTKENLIRAYEGWKWSR